MNIRKFTPLLVACLVLAASVVTIHILGVNREVVESELKLQQRRNQQLKRALVQLQKASSVQTINRLADGADAVRLSLLERLESIKKLPGVSNVRYKLRDSGGRFNQPDYLRTDVTFEVRHADTLLSLVASLDQAASIWPHLIRGCEVRRIDKSTELVMGLSANCIYDVYVWEALS